MLRFSATYPLSEVTREATKAANANSCEQLLPLITDPSFTLEERIQQLTMTEDYVRCECVLKYCVIETGLLSSIHEH